ncbi:hypothetical protein KTE45_03925 [Burkholderia multivorans]|uniref:hypothetical protein n=1 Tax=Burkholderia multivorans TaxID=87883 RepID=UPI001C264B77|nr:hypothetical protein [Burkholderia multivorans]MBU9517610.1 hypothetical protein [Burkholderia multivorans]
MKNPDDSFPQPPVVDANFRSRLIALQSATWPCNLKRFRPFKRLRDGDSIIYRPVCWDPYADTLHVLKIAGRHTPRGAGCWEQWKRSAADHPLDDIYLVDESLIPLRLTEQLEKLPSSCVVGFERRMSLLRAFAFVDPAGNGNPQDFLLNDFIFICESTRIESAKRVCSALGQPRGYQTYLRELLHKYTYNGGHWNSLMKLSFRQGGKGKSRVGKYKTKPGRLSVEEAYQDARSKALGEAPLAERRYPVRTCDEEKFVRALTKHWALARLSLADTYRAMVSEEYPKWPLRLVPTIGMFRYHKSRLIAEYDLKRLRYGRTLSAQYLDARVGQASHLTQGVIEIVDVDGFVAKVGVAVRVGKTIKSIHLTVVFAVSRLSGAILGYEIAMKDENAEAFRRCIASIFLSKTERARELGFQSTKGLVSGNIDAIFVDNGAGASEEVVVAACENMRLMRMLPPPGRGDLKGVGEGVNGIMVKMMARVRSGFTRATDPLSREIRRLKRNATPISFDDFERLLLKAIMEYNTTTNKRRLRTPDMRKAGIGIYPAAIFEYTQQAPRRGDAAVRLTPREVYDRFIPWKPYTCRGGLIHFQHLRYWSDELTAVFNDHVKGDDRGPLRVNVKRLDGSPHTLMWLRHDGSVTQLQLVEEDERALGPCHTWKQWDLMWMDDLLQGKKLARKSVQTGMRLTIGEHRNIGEVARRRAEVNPGLLFGASVRGARLNAEAKRNASRAAEQAKAYGLVDTELTAEGRAQGDDAAVTCYPSQQSFYRTLTARLKDVL